MHVCPPMPFWLGQLFFFFRSESPSFPKFVFHFPGRSSTFHLTFVRHPALSPPQRLGPWSRSRIQITHAARKHGFTLKSRALSWDCCRSIWRETRRALFDNSPADERAQPPSINLCRRCACFPGTGAHSYFSRESHFGRLSQLLMPLVRNRIGK